MKRRAFIKSLSAACMGIAAALYAPGVLSVMEPVKDGFSEGSLWFEMRIKKDGSASKCGMDIDWVPIVYKEGFFTGLTA